MNNRLFFNGKVIIITGASGGIGQAAAIFLSELGAKVVIASRNEEKLLLLSDDIRSKGGQAMAIRTDISSYEDTERLVAETVLKWGRIDILIANAGIYVSDISNEIDIQSYQKVMSVNFFGTLNTIKSVLPEMKRKGSGHIVIVNSLDSKKGIAGDGPYVSTKSALDGFGDVLRQENRTNGINITSIYPGRVNTPMIKNLKVPWISPKIPSEKVVKALVKGIKRNKAHVIVPSAFFFLGSLNNLSPRFLDWMYRTFRIEGEWVES